jgi:hypothetical protein
VDETAGMKHLALVLVVATLPACKKKEESEPAAPRAPSAKATEPKESGPFAGWGMAARRAAFQGAHVTPGSSLGAWEAWNVAGDKVTIWDGKTEKTLEFKLVSPCEAKITERSGSSSSSTTTHYTLKDGQIVKGLGDAGSRRGGEAIACVSNKVFTLDAAGKCTEWSASMFDDGKYEPKPATCSFKQEGGKEVFAVTVHGHETTLDVHGDALLSEQLARDHSEKVADFAAAKAARDAKK